MASAEGGSVPNGVGYGDGCPLSSRLGGMGKRRELPPSGVRCRAPAENGFWRILKATERSFLYLYDKNLRGTICTSVPPTPNSRGTCPPCPPVIYAHGLRGVFTTRRYTNPRLPLPLPLLPFILLGVALWNLVSCLPKQTHAIHLHSRHVICTLLCLVYSGVNSGVHVLK